MQSVQGEAIFLSAAYLCTILALLRVDMRGPTRLRNIEQRVVEQDMGGGTFDVSLLTIEDGIFEVKAASCQKAQISLSPELESLAIGELCPLPWCTISGVHASPRLGNSFLSSEVCRSL